MKGEETLVRFFDKIKFIDNHWIWIGGKNSSGHGRFFYKGKLWTAPRFSYECFVGPLKKGYFALHKQICGNPSCVKPSHLYAGTAKDNRRDSAEWGAIAQDGVLMGEKHGMAKLTEEDVRVIRYLYEVDKISQKEIAKWYPVTRVEVTLICSRKSWAHIL